MICIDCGKDSDGHGLRCEKCKWKEYTRVYNGRHPEAAEKRRQQAKARYWLKHQQTPEYIAMKAQANEKAALRHPKAKHCMNPACGCDETPGKRFAYPHYCTHACYRAAFANYVHGRIGIDLRVEEAGK